MRADKPGAPAAAAPMSLGDDDGSSGGEGPAVQVRSDFRSTVIWRPDLRTGPDGKATVTVKLPDSLTAYRATARSATIPSQFGTAAARIRARQPLMARLQAPRFFVAGDSAVISAIIDNNTSEPLSVRAALEAEGLAVRGVLRQGQVVEGGGDIPVAAGGEVRVDWAVLARQAGPARLKVTARAGNYADAMENAVHPDFHPAQPPGGGDVMESPGLVGPPYR